MIYIALLRGINVGGKNKIKMLDLKAMFESLSFKNVKTYIQSGNIIFDYDATDTMKLTNKIQEKINETFGFLVKTIIRSAEDFRNIANNNPFIKEPNIDLDKLYVTLMLEEPDQNTVLILDMKKEENEEFLIISKEIYLYCPNGYGETKLNISSTTRNCKTINNILGLI